MLKSDIKPGTEYAVREKRIGTAKESTSSLLPHTGDVVSKERLLATLSTN